MKEFNVNAYMLRQKSIDALIGLVTILCLLTIIYWVSVVLRPLPDVMWSYTKDECVAIYYEDEKCDCSDLPDKYNRIWVQ